MRGVVLQRHVRQRRVLPGHAGGVRQRLLRPWLGVQGPEHLNMLDLPRGARRLQGPGHRRRAVLRVRCVLQRRVLRDRSAVLREELRNELHHPLTPAARRRRHGSGHAFGVDLLRGAECGNGAVRSG